MRAVSDWSMIARGAPGGGDHVEAADALLDARDVARVHRQVAQAEAEPAAGQSAARPAISPQTLIGMPRREAASIANWMSRNTPGAAGCRDKATLLVAAVDRQGVLDQVVGADCEEIRLGRERVGAKRAPGTSIITPKGGSALGETYAAAFQPAGHPLERLAQPGGSLRRSRSSATGCARARRMPRATSPRAAGPRAGGAAGRGGSRAGREPGWRARRCARSAARAIFSPPRSKVRTVTGRPSMPRTNAEKIAYCSSSLGRSSRFM